MPSTYLVGGTGYIINLDNVMAIEYEGNEVGTKARIIGAGNAHLVLEGHQAVAFLHWVQDKMPFVDAEEAFAEGKQ